MFRLQAGAIHIVERRPGMSRRVLIHLNVGTVDVLVALGATVTRRQPRRETGTSPAVARHPGESPKCISKNCRYPPRYLFVGNVAIEGGQGASLVSYWCPIFLCPF